MDPVASCESPLTVPSRFVKSDGPGAFGTWTSIVYVPAQPSSWTTQLSMPEYVFFYRTGSSTAVIGRFDPVTGVFSQVSSIAGFGTNWQKPVPPDYAYPTLGLRRFDAVHDLLGTVTAGTPDTKLVPFANGTVFLHEQSSFPVPSSGTSIGVVERTSGWRTLLRTYPSASLGAFSRYVPLGIL